MTVNQYQGYVFENFCRLLLESSGFSLMSEDNIKVRYRGSSNIVEICGRGTWHQIDLPYQFDYSVPFVNPIRIIGEVKHYKYPITKNSIRNFIGVVKDISENHITVHIYNPAFLFERTLDQALFISRTAFQMEAQKLAIAHNIKLITIDDNPIILKLFSIFQTHYQIEYDRQYLSRSKKLLESDLGMDELEYINNTINANIKTYFLGTTITGHLLYFVSESEFNFEHHEDNGVIYAYITYPTVNNYLTGSIEMQIGQHRFVSTLPNLIIDEFQAEHDVYRNAIQSKYHHFSPLTVYKRDRFNKLKVYTIYFNYERR